MTSSASCGVIVSTWGNSRHCLKLGECRVQVANGAVTGFVIVKPAHFFGRDFIELVMVDPALRRSGIGRALLWQALSAAGTSQVFTSTNTSNHPMRSLLQAEDWSFSGELDGLDEGDLEPVFYKIRPAKPAKPATERIDSLRHTAASLMKAADVT